MKEWFSRRMNVLQDLRKAKSFKAASRHWIEAKRPLEEGARRFRGRKESCWRTRTTLSLWNQRYQRLVSMVHRGRQNVIRGDSRGRLERNKIMMLRVGSHEREIALLRDLCLLSEWVCEAFNLKSYVVTMFVPLTIELSFLYLCSIGDY